jgi:hypothetical protein
MLALRHRLSRGTIQRGIKMIKRQMFGRASLPLRKRVLLTVRN